MSHSLQLPKPQQEARMVLFLAGLLLPSPPPSQSPLDFPCPFFIFYITIAQQLVSPETLLEGRDTEWAEAASPKQYWWRRKEGRQKIPAHE